MAAQKALSCVHRTGQRFGVKYLIDVLPGTDHERIRRFGHDRITTFGIGKELDADQWQSVFRQLVGGGLSAVDVEGHGALSLTEQSRPVLRGERQAPPAPRPGAAPQAGSARKPWRRPGPGRSGRCGSALRAHRRELAQSQGVPPYVIFDDATLKEMVTYRPRNPAELACISGVGIVKLERYGDGFLGVLAGHAAEHGRPADCPPLPEAPIRAVPRIPRSRCGRRPERHGARDPGAAPGRRHGGSDRRAPRHQAHHRL